MWIELGNDQNFANCAQELDFNSSGNRGSIAHTVFLTLKACLRSNNERKTFRRGRVTEDKQFCNDLWVFSEISLEAQIYSMIDGRDAGDGISSVGRKQGIKSIFKLDCSHSMLPVIMFSTLLQIQFTQLILSQRTLSGPSKMMRVDFWSVPESRKLCL